MSKYKSFEDLEVYQKAVSFAVEIYKLSNQGDLKTDFGLRDQLRRATISISNNIAEGFEHQNNKQFIRFLFYSKASAGEVRNLLTIIEKVGYMDEKTVKPLTERCVEISKQLSNFIKYLEK